MNKLLHLFLFCILFVKLANAQQADLSVSVVLDYNGLTVGAFAFAQINVTNSGQGNADNLVNGHKLYLCSQSTFSVQNSILLGNFGESSIAAGQTVALYTYFTVPIVPSAGTYHMFAVADANNVVSETVENNNVSVGLPIFVSIPQKSNVTFNTNTIPTTATAGTAPSVSVRLRNNGIIAAAASKLHVFLSVDSLLDGGDIFVRQMDYTAINAGALQNKNFTLPLPSNLSGTYWVIAVADALNSNDELNENDNFLRKQIQITATTAKPNLSVLSASTTSPSSTPSAQIITVNFSIRNASAVVSNKFTGTLYLSNNNVLDQNDVNLMNLNFDPMTGNTTRTFTGMQVYLPLMSVGSRFLLFVADSYQEVSETNENNNVLARAIAITTVPTDLTITGLGGQVNAPYSNPLYVYEHVKAQITVGAHKVRLYYSTDSVYNATDPMVFDYAVDSVKAFESAQVYFTPNMPTQANTNTTPFFLIARADATNTIAEAIETNNNYVYKVGTDFVVSSYANILFAKTTVEGYPIFKPGNSFTMYTGLSNYGNLYKDSVNVRVYLSSDNTFNAASDLLLWNTKSAINGFEAKINLPSTLALGNYTVFVQVDGNNEWTELDETNNVASQGTISIVNTAASDIVVNSISSPNTLISNQSFTTNISIRNIGEVTNTGANAIVRLTISSLSNYTAYTSDVLLPAVNSGATVIVPISGLLPYGFQGDALLTVDVYSVENEFQIVNNKLSKAIQTLDVRPDYVVNNVNVVQSGNNLQVACQIRNIGNLAGAAARVGFILLPSSSYYYNSGYNGYSGDSLGVCNALAINGTQNMNFTIPIQEGLFDDNYVMQINVNTNSLTQFTEINNYNNAGIDTFALDYSDPNYTFFEYGSGTGMQVRKISTGGYQIIAKDSTAAKSMRMIYTDGLGLQLSATTLGNVEVGFGANDGYIVADNTDSANVRVRTYSSAGALIQTKTFTTGGATKALAITGTSDGGYIIVGSQPNAYAPDYQNTYQPPITKGWVLKVNSAGTSQWTQSFGSLNANSLVHSVCQLNDGRYAVGASLGLNSYYYNTVGHFVYTLGTNGAIEAAVDSILAYSYYYTYSVETPCPVLEPAGSGLLHVTNYSYYSNSNTTTSTLRRTLSNPISYVAHGYYSFYVGNQIDNDISVRFSAAEQLSNESVLGSGDFYNFLPRSFTLFKVDNTGALLWKKKGPGIMEDMITAGNNLYALTGTKNTKVCLVFINGDGEPALPSTTSGGDGMDLSIDVQVSNPTAAIYTTVPVRVIATNQGNQACTAATIKVQYPAHPAIAFSGATLTEGTYNTLTGIWTLPAGFTAGETDTLTLSLFTLNLAPQTIYAQVQTATPSDIDSQPGNGTCCSGVQDDEAAGTIDPPGALMMNETPLSNHLTWLSIQPNPATTQTQLQFTATKAGSMQIQIFNSEGRMLSHWTESYNEGNFSIDISVQELPVGVYILRIEDQEGIHTARQLMVQK